MGISYDQKVSVSRCRLAAAGTGYCDCRHRSYRNLQHHEHTALQGQYKKQIYWLILSIVLALADQPSRLPLPSRTNSWLYILSVLVLGELLVAGHAIAKTKRWLHFAGLTFQVSELVKLVIILCVAAYFAERRGKSATWGDLVKLGLLAAVPAILVALEPDLGTALTFFAIVGAGILLAGIRWRQVAVLLLLGVLCLAGGMAFPPALSARRFMTFFHPSQDMQGTSYQVTQTKIAIGSGGLRGKGIGNGTQSRLGFIPVSQADAIFAAFAEEQGFVGTLIVLLLYFALLLRLLDGAQMAPDRAGAFLLVGLASVLFFQVAINTGMMIGLFPVTGIPLPLMSQGGSSLLFTFLGLGVAMNVRARRFVN